MVDGDIEFILTDEENELLSYSRFDDKSEIIAVFNANDETKEIQLPVKFDGEYVGLLNELPISKDEERVSFSLPARTGAIIGLDEMD